MKHLIKKDWIQVWYMDFDISKLIVSHAAWLPPELSALLNKSINASYSLLEWVLKKNSCADPLFALLTIGSNSTNNEFCWQNIFPSQP